MIKTKEGQVDRQEVDNKLYVLALRAIGFKGGEEEVLRRAEVTGRAILSSIEADHGESLLVRSKGGGLLPSRLELGALGGDPVEFVARLAALAVKGGEAEVYNIEIGWSANGYDKFPVFTLSNGELKACGGFAQAVTAIRQFMAR